MDVGVGISADLPATEQLRLAEEVEAAGFRSLWSSESTGRDAMLLCLLRGMATSRIELGVGVSSIWTRTPAQLAMAAATLQEATGGRLLLGLGVGHPAHAAQWQGAAYTKPLTAMREVLAITGQLAGGEASDVRGDVFFSKGFRLDISPRPAPARRYLAAMGPRMLALAGARVDGVLLNWCRPDELARAGVAVRQAAAEAGRDPGQVDVAGYVRVAVSPERGEATVALAAELARTLSLPAYVAHFERQGFGEAVARAQAAEAKGADAAGLAEAFGEMLTELAWVGTPDDRPAGVLDDAESAGLDHLVARVVMTGSDRLAAAHRAIGILRPLAGPDRLHS